MVLTGILAKGFGKMRVMSQKIEWRKKTTSGNLCQLPTFHAPPFSLPPIPRGSQRAVTRKIGCHSDLTRLKTLKK